MDLHQQHPTDHHHHLNHQVNNLHMVHHLLNNPVNKFKLHMVHHQVHNNQVNNHPMELLNPVNNHLHTDQHPPLNNHLVKVRQLNTLVILKPQAQLKQLYKELLLFNLQSSGAQQQGTYVP
ncbi:hypothetical protein AKO1_004890, partial [Acrasis kona]